MLGSPQRETVIIWDAQPRQSAFISCPADDVGFGGARGGGKSDAVIGDWISHEDLYGKDATGMAFRRERTQLVELIERGRQILTPLGYKWHEKDSFFRGPRGGRLRFSYLESDSDADAYQGHSYCVAVGTRIRMADGGLKPIEQIGIGELVATLEGPRLVSFVTSPYVAPCVRAVVRDSAGLVVGSQIHPVWHPVLTTSGLISSPLPHAPRIVWRPRFSQFFGDKQDQGFASGEDQGTRGWRAWSKDGRSAHIGLNGKRPAFERHGLQIVPVALHGPSVQSARGPSRAGRVSTLCRSRGKLRRWWSGLDQSLSGACQAWQQLAVHVRSVLGLCVPYSPNASANVPNDFHVVPGFQFDYLSGRGFDGARALGRTGTCPDGTPRLGGVGNKSHGWLSGVLGTIRPRSRSASAHWVHPYTGEARHLSEEVTSGTMELHYAGLAFVADLTVEGANHYISECGLVNKNTRLYAEEMGTFPSEAPINKLQATLRSGNGVPCQMKGTCNPGGPGHQWVKARYKLAEYPAGFEIFRFEFENPFTKKKIEKTRVFIPSKVSDNKFLGDDYVANLFQVGSPNLVRAWLEGDWSVIEGAFFDCWSATRHVIRPFTIPSNWVRIRSMDWGYAAPFSVQWWAVAAEQYQSGTVTIPRGCLICYREWYGKKGPNEGLRLDAEEVAKEIARLEAGEKIDRAVLDPSAFAQNGGPSIAERMATSHKVRFGPADNTRVAQRGALSGWDAMRGRLTGDDDGNPMLVFFSTCHDSIRTIPALQHDEHRAEDIDTDGEDHAADSVRYACNARPWVRTVKPKQLGKTLQNITLNDLWAQRQKELHSGD